MVWKLDRLSQSLKQLITTVERLGERAIGFRSLTERIDTTSAGGKLTFFERGIIRERTLAGLAAARAHLLPCPALHRVPDIGRLGPHAAAV